MGRRLYPILKDGVTTAMFLGIPKEAEGRLSILEKECEVARIEGGDEYEAWLELRKDEEAYGIFGFNLYGWGSFTPIHGIPDTPYGECRDMNLVVELLVENLAPIDSSQIELMDGVYWG